MRDFTLKTKNTALCCLNGNKAKMMFHGGAMTTDINEMRKEIEDALKMRNYEVPGVDVEFWHSIDNDGQHIIRIASIDCGLPDIRIGSNYHIRVRGFEMSLHEDNSGSLEVYCGRDWDKDREEFVNGKRFHRKMDGKSRIVLQYNTSNGSTYRATDDCNRGHYPDGTAQEPMHYTIAQAEERIILGLYELLNHINTFPEQAIDENLFSEPVPMPLKNESVMKKVILHTRISTDAVYRIRNKKEKGNHAIDGDYRLLPLGIRLPEHPHSQLMHDGFVYCELEFPGQEITENNWNGSSMRETHLVPLKLAHTNNVFVVDAHAGEEFKKKWFEANPESDRMTNESYEEMQVTRAMTMVHINDYDGSFKKPLVIIGRSIAKKEVVLPKESLLSKLF